MDPEAEGYSVFDGLDPQGRKLTDLLKDREVRELFVGGLATDYCVKQTVLDALARGFTVFLLYDATKGVNVLADDTDQAIREMKYHGAHCVNYDKVEGMILSHPQPLFRKDADEQPEC
jgi:nicotinamidase/pyrazinamidase